MITNIASYARGMDEARIRMPVLLSSASELAAWHALDNVQLVRWKHFTHSANPPCHASESRASLMFGDIAGAVDIICWAGCDIASIEDALGARVQRRTRSGNLRWPLRFERENRSENIASYNNVLSHAVSDSVKPPDAPRLARAPRDFARHIRRQLTLLDAANDLPFRAWCAKHNIWRSDEPPPRLFWLPAASETFRYGWRGEAGAGALVVPRATLAQWNGRKSNNLGAFTALAITPKGNKAYFYNKRGVALDRRAYGSVGRPSFFMLGRGCSEDAHIVEGLKDALAIASRYYGAVYATLGHLSRGHAAGFARSRIKRVMIWADRDMPDKRGVRAGLRNAAVFQEALGAVAPRIDCRIREWDETRYGKDPGDLAQHLPLPPMAERDDAFYDWT